MKGPLPPEDNVATSSEPASRWYRRMAARDSTQPHRTATPLELFFDLCFVVAIAFAAEELQHAIVEERFTDGIVRYLAVFFGIWWAWMNFTWFASAYDTDDVPYRLATFLQMTGVLIMAAGIPRIFANADFTVAVLGYVVMRLAMVPQWVRAAKSDPPRRKTAHRYAIAITVAQIIWVLLLLVTEYPEFWLPAFVIGACVELLIPVWAESAAPTTWHHHHIGERYGLFTLIVLGETILASTIAIQSALDAGHDKLELLQLAGVGLLTVFSMWWLYFDRPTFGPTEPTVTSLRVFVWGYGHLPLFGSIAAMGAGLVVAIDREVGAAEISARTSALAIAIPVAVYLVVLWAIRLSRDQFSFVELALPAGAFWAAMTAALGLPVHFVALDITAISAIMAADWYRSRHEAHTH
jgi:low temperature requirement protein LtrA